MQRIITLILLALLLPSLAEAKKRKKRKWTTRDVITISDYLLRAQMGDSLFRYCRYDASSYYVLGDSKDKYFLPLLPQKKLHRQFLEARITYHFTMPWGECPLYDTVAGDINVELIKQDTGFAFASEPVTAFIPTMAASRLPCTFISEKAAIDIALKDTLIRGVNPPYAVLTYRPKTQKFTWLVFSLLWNERDFSNQEEPKKDVVFVDAETGDVTEHKKVSYTTHISNIY